MQKMEQFKLELQTLGKIDRVKAMLEQSVGRRIKHNNA